jgi:hypothetical protein
MGISITFTNYSTTAWTRSISGSETDAVLQNLTKSPGPVLQANAGVEAIAADQSALSFIATGAIDLYCCWYDPASGQRFGVQLWYPVQVFGIGKAPYWYVMSDRGKGIGDPADWQNSGDDPSYPFEWSTVAGFKIRASPTAGHTSLDIEVVVESA